jgi:tRNA-2-methylthio-N6-dimethylallyladenosine synthase
VREVSLLGQNVMAFGTDRGARPGEELILLMEKLGGIGDLARVRLITAHPRDVEEWFVRAARDLDQFCPQFQMPFQAGSDAVLERMGRGYTRQQYLDRIGWIRDVFEDPGIFVDVIVGFPGETREQFGESLSLLEMIDPDRTYVFKYNPRPGTRAAQWQDDVSAEEKQRRLTEVEDLYRELALRKNEGLVGSTVEILVEGPSKRDASKLTGRTPQGRICIVPAEPQLTGKIVEVNVESVSPVCLYGRVVGI